MEQIGSKLLVNHTFQGGRFIDHGIDLDILEDVVRYKSLLVETAKDLWRQRNAARERLPKNFEESLRLKFYEVRPNCATLPLCREFAANSQEAMFDQPDELDEAVTLVAEAINAANVDQPLPSAFPRRLIGLFSDYGKCLGPDEWIELTPRGWQTSVRYDAVSRQRLQRYVNRTYDDYVDLTGVVTMARVSKPKMAIELSDGREIEAAFRDVDEATITTALKEHATAKLRVIGRGTFSGEGQLQRIIQVHSVSLLAGGVEQYNASAKPIWEEFDEIVATIPPEELAQLPRDGAEHHDRYVKRALKAGE